MWRIIAVSLFVVWTSTPAAAEWFWINKNSSDKLIVFVHGLRGDPKESFKGGERSWPELMAADTERVRASPALSTYSIALVGYPAGGGNRLNLREIAYRLLVELDDGAVLDQYKDVIFITHSLGGLVIKDLLVAARKDNYPISKKVAAVFLIAVPSKGTPAAEWALKLFSEPLMEDLKPIDVNSYLQALDDDWNSLVAKRDARRPRVFCAYERQPTLGVTVLPIVYSYTHCDERPWAENKDHFAIVKPPSVGDSMYGWVRGRIASLYQSGANPQPTPVPPTGPKEVREPPKSLDPITNSVTEKAYASLMSYARSVIVSKSNWRDNIGKSVGDLYIGGVAPKALAVCVYWETSTPDNMVATKTYFDYSSKVPRSESQVKSHSLQNCETLRTQSGEKCQCIHVDFSGRNVLEPPAWWIKKHSAP